MYGEKRGAATATEGRTGLAPARRAWRSDGGDDEEEDMGREVAGGDDGADVGESPS